MVTDPLDDAGPGTALLDDGRKKGPVEAALPTPCAKDSPRNCTETALRQARSAGQFVPGSRADRQPEAPGLGRQLEYRTRNVGHARSCLTPQSEADYCSVRARYAVRRCHASRAGSLRSSGSWSTWSQNPWFTSS